MTWRRGLKPAGWYPRRGEICLFALDKERPGLVVSTDALNRFSRDVCIVPISKAEHRQFSLRPRLKSGAGGLQFDSCVKCDQVTSVEISTAVFPALGALDRESMRRVEDAMRVALELPEKE
jgi:mRNA-degrading endonuclease toxin of MazEF toxin-antitoxin module